jgi:hypothetical protein
MARADAFDLYAEQPGKRVGGQGREQLRIDVVAHGSRSWWR